MIASPILTLVACTVNRAGELASALEKLARLRLPARRVIQFIVIDNGSTDHTRALLAAASRRLPFPAERLHEPGRGLAMARNLAPKHARGDVIAWTDDGCTPAEDWLERLTGYVDFDPLLGILGGRVKLLLAGAAWDGRPNFRRDATRRRPLASPRWRGVPMTPEENTSPVRAGRRAVPLLSQSAAPTPPTSGGLDGCRSARRSSNPAYSSAATPRSLLGLPGCSVARWRATGRLAGAVGESVQLGGDPA